MTEQRIVPLELLSAIGKALEDSISYVQTSYDEQPEPESEWDYNACLLCGEIQSIISGPGVDLVAIAIESVASWIESQRNGIPATGAEFADAIRSEFKFSPQPPAK